MSEGRQPGQPHKLFCDQPLHSPEKGKFRPINLILGDKKNYDSIWFSSKTDRRNLSEPVFNMVLMTKLIKLDDI
jgi:hypothetical protein